MHLNFMQEHGIYNICGVYPPTYVIKIILLYIYSAVVEVNFNACQTP